MNTAISKKQSEELNLATQLLDALGHRHVAVMPDDRPDVLACIDGSRIGIEVTQFHADEQQGAKGSPLRATEEGLAKQSAGGSYLVWGVLNPNPALVARITDKIKTAAAYNSSRYSELWLLVAAGVPKLGAVGATLALPSFINVQDLNLTTHELLCDSSFSAVYLHALLPPAIYCWSRHKKWHTISLNSLV